MHCHRYIGRLIFDRVVHPFCRIEARGALMGALGLLILGIFVGYIIVHGLKAVTDW